MNLELEWDWYFFFPKPLDLHFACHYCSQVELSTVAGGPGGNVPRLHQYLPIHSNTARNLNGPFTIMMCNGGGGGGGGGGREH